MYGSQGLGNLYLDFCFAFFIETGLLSTWKTWKNQRTENLFKKSWKSQGIYQENGQVREMSGNFKA